jgi:hypothetical protein
MWITTSDTFSKWTLNKLQKMPPLTGLGIYLAWVFYIYVSPTGFNLCFRSFSCYFGFAFRLVAGGAAFFAKVGFLRFLLGNREKLAVVANAGPIHLDGKMAG